MKQRFFFAVFVLLLVCAYGRLAFLTAEAAEPVGVNPTVPGPDDKPVRGWAWSIVEAPSPGDDGAGIGWIRMSRDTPREDGAADPAQVPPYGVWANTQTGALFGHAWSGIACEPGSSEVCGYGWLSFEPGDLANCPGGGECRAYIDYSTGKVHGWARFLAGFEDPDAWDGWVRLRGAGGGANFGVCFGDTRPVGGSGGECQHNGVFDANATFSGWAWGNDVVGWMRFLRNDTILAPRFWVEAVTEDENGAPLRLPQARLVWQNEESYTEIEVHLDARDLVPEPALAEVPVVVFTGEEDERLLRGERNYLDVREEGAVAPLVWGKRYIYTLTYKKGPILEGKVSASVTFPPEPIDLRCSVAVAVDPARVTMEPGGRQVFTARAAYSSECEADVRDGTVFSWEVLRSAGGAPGLGQMVSGAEATREYLAPTAIDGEYSEVVQVTATYPGGEAKNWAKVFVAARARIVRPVACVDLGGGGARATIGYEDKITSAHSLKITRTGAGGEVLFVESFPAAPERNETGAVKDKNIASGGVYHYAMFVDYGDGAGFVEVSNASAECGEIDDTPSKLTATAQAPDTDGDGVPDKHRITLQWNDKLKRTFGDAARPYAFEIERLRATPDAPTDLRLENFLDYGSGSYNPFSAALRWRNGTRHAPFTHLIEKSHNGTGETFLAADGRRTGEQYRSGREINPANTEFEYYYLGGSTMGLNEASTYYFRVAGCSDVPGLKAKYPNPDELSKPGGAEINTHDQPDPACSDFTDALSYTTPPRPPSPGVRALSKSEIFVAWSDSSDFETSYKVERRKGSAGAWTDITASASCGYNEEEVRFECRDTGLESDTTYEYRVGYFMDDPVEGRGRLVAYNYPAARGTTHYTVRVASVPRGSVVIDDSSSTPVTCTGTCGEYEFPKEVRVSISSEGGVNADWQFHDWSGAKTAGCGGSNPCFVSGSFDAKPRHRYRVTIDSVSSDARNVNIVRGDGVSVGCSSASAPCTGWIVDKVGYVSYSDRSCYDCNLNGSSTAGGHASISCHSDGPHSPSEVMVTGGRATPSRSSGVYACDTVSYSASADENYEFVGWSYCPSAEQGDYNPETRTYSSCGSFYYYECSEETSPCYSGTSAIPVFREKELPEPGAFIDVPKQMAALLESFLAADRINKSNWTYKSYRTNWTNWTIGKLWTKVTRVFSSVDISGKNVPMALAAGGAAYENFFSRITDSVQDVVYHDLGSVGEPLLNDSVYLYRVRVKYGGGGVSKWSNEAAGKTLRPVLPQIVASVPAPTARIWAYPGTSFSHSGGEPAPEVVISWQTTGADRVELVTTPAAGDETARAAGVAGNVRLPVKESTTFTVRAINDSGSAYASVKVTVNGLAAPNYNHTEEDEAERERRFESFIGDPPVKTILVCEPVPLSEAFGTGVGQCTGSAVCDLSETLYTLCDGSRPEGTCSDQSDCEIQLGIPKRRVREE